MQKYIFRTTPIMFSACFVCRAYVFCMFACLCVEPTFPTQPPAYLRLARFDNAFWNDSLLSSLLTRHMHIQPSLYVCGRVTQHGHFIPFPIVPSLMMPRGWDVRMCIHCITYDAAACDYDDKTHLKLQSKKAFIHAQANQSCFALFWNQGPGKHTCFYP
jgi:hypothetical protein